MRRGLGRSTAVLLIAHAVVLAAAFLWNIAWGAVSIPPGVVARLLAEAGLGWPAPPVSDAVRTIVLVVRLPHAALIALVGMALGASGAAYQGLFRNPLADPYLLGVASGAGLGAVLALSAAWPADLAGMYRVPAAAFAGALLTVALVYGLAHHHGQTQTATLILAGVAVSSVASALMSFLMLRSTGELRRALTYLLGGAPLLGWKPVLAMLPYWAVGMAALLTTGHALNVLQFGEEQAHALGLPVEATKAFILAAASLTTAAAVAFGGVIGFVGLMVPHGMRLLWGGDYRRLLPLAALGGGAALLLFDWVARVALRPQTLPVGVVTALVGGVFFLGILLRARRGPGWM